MTAPEHAKRRRPTLSATNISWATHVCNPLGGCAKVSEGCERCWAIEMGARLARFGRDEFSELVQVGESGRPNWTRRSSLTIEGGSAMLPQLEALIRRRSPAWVFIGSMTDLFWAGHGEQGQLAVAGAILLAHPGVECLTLTKRLPEALSFLDRWLTYTSPVDEALEALEALVEGAVTAAGARRARAFRWRLPPHWWFGATIENQRRADERLPLLRMVPASLRWVSAEPLLEGWSMGHGFDWLVLGGESGAGARPCDAGAMKAMALVARGLGIAVHIKQLGRHAVAAGGRDGRAEAGAGPERIRLRHPMGGDPAEWPEWMPAWRAIGQIVGVDP